MLVPLMKSRITLAIGVIWLAIAVALIFWIQFNSDASAEVIGDPIPEHLRMGLPDYVLETGRYVEHPDGKKEILFESPKIESKEIRDAQRAEAIAKGDPSLLPYCAPEDKPSPDERRDPQPEDFGKMPLCISILGLGDGRIPVGPPGAASFSTSVPVKMK